MINKMFDVTNRRALVTGAGQGLGYGIAEGFLESGCKVVLMDISDKLDGAVRTFCKRKFNAFGVKGDLADRKQIDCMWKETMAILGGIDILVTAAGIQIRHPSEDFPIEDWDKVININLNAIFILNQLAGREMIKQGKGKIINITSMVSWFGGVKVPAYTAAKGAVTQMTKCLANDWMAKGVNVNAIAPGYMLTDMNEKILEDQVRKKEITDRIPAKRWGSPEDMKGTALFLASAASDYLSGAIIPVDGGYLVR